MTRTAVALTALSLTGCAFGPAMYFRAIEVSKLGPDDIERLDTETRTGKGLFGPPFSRVLLRTRASVPETVRIYRQRLREKGWQEWDRLSGSLECWYCAPECRQGRACSMVFTSPDSKSTVGVSVKVHNEREFWWQEKFKSTKYEIDADKYTWVRVYTSN